jgi:hypothetical protein
MMRINREKKEITYNHKEIKKCLTEQKMRNNEVRTDDEIVWSCQYCGSDNGVWVDFTIRGKQDFIEDCALCCRPNRIIITSDYEDNTFIEARPYDG